MGRAAFVGFVAAVSALAACTSGESSPAGPTQGSGDGLVALAIRESCVGSSCGQMPQPSRLASIANAKACNLWQLNADSHGGPDYLVKLLAAAGDVDRIRSAVTRLPGVRSVEQINRADLGTDPAPDTGFPLSRRASCR